jgi:hypothetical protein
MTQMGAGQPGAAAQPAAPGGQGLKADEKTWGMLCHLAALVGFIGIPFGNIVGPLVVWLIKKEGSRFVDANGKEALNFQITVAIAALICIPLMLIIIGFFLLAAVGIFDLVMIIMAAVKTNQGIAYRYPVAIRFIK